MKFTKTTLAAALLTSLSISAFAAEEITFYGKANVTLQSNDEGDGRYTELRSNASRLGVKGTHKVDENLSVIYQAEFEVDIDSDGDVFKDRNQYIGLKGNFGEVLAGNNDTVLKQSQGSVDLFSDLNGDIKELWVGENRVKNSLTYKSPKFNDLQLGVTYITDDENKADADESFSLSLVYGDKKLKKSTFYAAVAFDADVEGQSKDKAVAKQGYDVTRITVQGKVGEVIVGGIYHNQQGQDGSDMDGFLVSAKYSQNKLTYKGQYQTASHDGGDDRSGLTLGADYTLTKQAKLFAFYSTFDMDSASDEDFLGAGIEYNF